MSNKLRDAVRKIGDRERETLGHVAHGDTYGEITRPLNVAPQAVGKTAATGIPLRERERARETVPFADLLKRHRGRSGLTQQQLADFATLSVRAIRDLESGRVRRPRRESVGLLADALRLGDTERLQLHAAGGSPTHLRVPLYELPAPPALPEPPAPPGALVGREAELQVLLDQVTVHRHRLVSVVGIGGIGKTHLVLAAAQSLRAKGWRVGWHTPAGDPLCCGATSAAGSRSGEPPPGAAGPADDLVEAIGERYELLMIDGDDAWGPGRVDIGELLRRCPGLRVVVTGLTPRHLPGERVLPLTAMTVPEEARDYDHARLSEVASVALFLSHMRRSRPGFRLRPDNAHAVVGLCRWLDGVPRALEYAAGWCLVYPPELLLARAGRDSSLLSSPAGCGCQDLLRSVARSVDIVAERHRRVLAEVADRPHWTVADLGRLVPDPAAALHALLVHGLVRPAGARLPEHFTVLQLVRLLHGRDRTPMTTTAAAVRAG
ncbi:helix-turn-helix domain-containing protein [Streptomyces sp. NPDC020707]|uniref:helix-turn-helix domain-containing protein n=1 Tax=Streptomyces sp. NPDC020707 TaxID=3365084 RepID=UPI003797E00F